MGWLEKLTTNASCFVYKKGERIEITKTKKQIK